MPPIGLKIETLSAPDSDIAAAIQAGVGAFNESVHPPPDYIPLIVVGRDPFGNLCGGLDALTFFGWLYVRALWVDEPYRRDGIGSRLLQTGEAVAVERGCKAAYLDTMTFQAPDFYKRHGYFEVGRLENLLPSVDRITFRKMLAP